LTTPDSGGGEQDSMTIARFTTGGHNAASGALSRVVLLPAA
jgi:hypothetical protein